MLTRLALVADSSVFVGMIRQLCRGSVTCAAAVRVARSLSLQSSWIGTRLASHPPSRDFPGARQTASTSRILGLADGVFLAASSAWRGSAVKQVVFDSVAVRLETWQRIRLAGWVIVVAATVHALGSGASLHLSNAPAGWALALAGGALLMAGCRLAARAWGSWRGRPSGSAPFPT